MTQTPEQFTHGMIEKMNECAEEFCYKNNAGFLDNKTSYVKQTESFDNVRSHYSDVYFNSFIVRFCYYPHVSTSHSALTCYVSPYKTETERIFYPLSQLYGFFGICPENALTIPLILSPDSMKESFFCLGVAVETIIPNIQSLSYEPEQKELLFDREVEAAVVMLKKEFPTAEELQKFFDDIKKDGYETWKAEQPPATNEQQQAEEFAHLVSSLSNGVNSVIEMDKRSFLANYYKFLLIRSVSPAYEAYMTGNYTAASKKIKKIKNKTAYETILIEYIDNAKTPRPHVPESIYINLTELYKNGIPKNNLKEALMIVPAMLFFGLMWLPLFLAIYFLFYFFESRDALCLFGTLSNAPSVMFPSFICGILMIYFQSKRFYKFFFKKNYEQIIALDNAVNSRSTHRFMKALLGVLMSLSIVFLALTAHQNIKLCKTGFYDNTEFWSIKGEFYSYDEVEALYYREQTPSGYGSMIDIPSYVIVLKDNGEIDPYQFDSIDERFLDVFREKGVFVEPQP